MRFNHHNNIGIIIQARMGSKRLPRKVMKKIAGKEMILRIIERVKNANHLKKLLLLFLKQKKIIFCIIF